LVPIPLRIAIWGRDRQGRPAPKGYLIHHSDAGQYTAITFTESSALQEIHLSKHETGNS
jgi:hypothetical protein